jgi:Lrp/AsnC family leucine-responsive transcriptional regulator
LIGLFVSDGFLSGYSVGVFSTFREEDPVVKLDEVDLRILQVLQSNARIPIQDLANRVGLSPTPCSRRLRRLEDEAILEKYAAVLNPKILNFDITAFVSVQAQYGTEQTTEFRAAILKMPNVWGCWIVTGDYHYLLWVNAKDMQSLSRWIIDDLEKVPSVLHTRTSIVMEPIKDESSFFLPDLKTLKRFSMLREKDPVARLDEIDLHMLQILQSNARIPIQDLANHVGLSPTPCSRRLRRLEDKAIIKKYVAILNPKIFDLDLTAFVSVRVQHSPGMAVEFRAAVPKMPNVRGCYAVSGDYDYLLRANAKDMKSFSRWVVDDLDSNPPVVDTYTRFVVDSIKDEPFCLLRDLTAVKGQSAGDKVGPSSRSGGKEEAFDAGHRKLRAA